MYLLIAIWGWVVTREYAAMKLTLYLFIGSVVSLVGVLAMYWKSGLHTFDMLALETAGFSQNFQVSWFLPVFLDLRFLAVSGPSTTGRRMVTLPHRPLCLCFMQAC